MLSSPAVRESLQTGLSRGRRSRNKVSVGEPAEGSFQQQSKQKLFTPCSAFGLTTVVLALLRGVLFGLFLIEQNVASSTVFHSVSNYRVR